MRARLGSALTTAFVVTAGNAFARPGGGGSYHGGTGGGGGGGFGGGGFGGGGFGGFGGGGYHGGGSSVSGAGADLMVLVILLAVVFLFFAARRRRSAIDAGARDALFSAQADETAAVRRSVSLDTLRARDPALNEQSLADHVRQMADALRGAWCGGDMGAARAFVRLSAPVSVSKTGPGQVSVRICTAAKYHERPVSTAAYCPLFPGAKSFIQVDMSKAKHAFDARTQ